LTDIDEICYSDAHLALTADLPLKFQILKIKDGGGRHLENHKNCDISTMV